MTILGFAIIFAGVLINLDIYFRTTSLFNTLFMLALLFGGLGHPHYLIHVSPSAIMAWTEPPCRTSWMRTVIRSPL